MKLPTEAATPASQLPSLLNHWPIDEASRWNAPGARSERTAFGEGAPLRGTGINSKRVMAKAPVEGTLANIGCANEANQMPAKESPSCQGRKVTKPNAEREVRHRLAPPRSDQEPLLVGSNFGTRKHGSLYQASVTQVR